MRTKIILLMQWSLYDLKQALCVWFMRLHDFLVCVGFCPSKTDISLFVYSTGVIQLYLLVYVDDILVMGSDSAHVSGLVSRMAAEFKVRDMGAPTFFLRIEMVSHNCGLLLLQYWYMKSILKCAGMVGC